MSADWEITVRVKLRNVMEHSEGRPAVFDLISDEGGPLQAICGWCEPEDLEILDLQPIPSVQHRAAQK